jgi:hypothetical protein
MLLLLQELERIIAPSVRWGLAIIASPWGGCMPRLGVVRVGAHARCAATANGASGRLEFQRGK